MFLFKTGGNGLTNLEKMGWTQPIEKEEHDKLARVITVQKNSYRLSDGNMEFLAQVSGKYLHTASGTLDFPAVGDWVVVEKLYDEEKAVIKELLPRTSQFIRQAAGERTEAQLVAANVDTVFIVNALDHDFNSRRIERYILSTYESGATPVIIFTKKDSCSVERLEEVISSTEEIAIGVPIISVSGKTGEGLDQLLSYLPSGKTGALLGSSGVGKSTLINTLLGKEIQETRGIREDDSKGRHTTTHREMFRIPNGALLIDTPGMRELQLWEGEGAMGATFQDVEALEEACRFKDCQHDTEPGCRVKEAMDNGELSIDRFQSYLKLQRELAYEKRKQDQKALMEEKNKWKQISKDQKKKYRAR